MPAEIERKIEEIALPVIERNGAYIVEVAVRGERSSKVVEIFVDSDKGISLEECSMISRELSGLLDETNIIQGRYRLDVSSPGLDRPLKLHRQYVKNKGRNCKIFVKQNDGRVTKEGILEKIDEQSVTITSKGKSEEITFAEIIETYIVPKFK
jgi:ribosome maturation factor RimP